MSTELVLQLIILATAVVGLYKAATFGRQKTLKEPEMERQPVSSDGDKNSTLGEFFQPLFAMAGFFLFLLVFPAFVWAFIWITSNMSSTRLDSSAESEYSIPFEPSETLTETEVMFLAAVNMSFGGQRNAELEKVVKYALEQEDLRMALLAANAMSSGSPRNRQLQLIVDHVAQEKELDSGNQ